MSIVVFGSINMDLVVTVSRLPDPGETVAANGFFTASGGKGANQAIAAASIGCAVDFVGQVGGDNFGTSLLASLQAAGVKTDAVKINSSTHSGIAAISVAANGDNTIAVAAGANDRVGTAEINAFASLLPNAKVVLLELGVPLDTVVAAAKLARTAGVLVILDPAPIPDRFPAELYQLVDFITPNEVEAARLVGFPVSDRQSAARAAGALRAKGVNNAIVTLGKLGCCWAGEAETYFLEAIPVAVVDTVGAGDGFNGAMAAALASGKSLQEALKWATVMGSLTVTKKGATGAIAAPAEFFRALDTAFPSEK